MGIVNLTSQFSGSVGTPLFYGNQLRPTTAPVFPARPVIFRSPNLGSNQTFKPNFGFGQVVAGAPASTFIFRGFYATGNVYETWQGTSRNTPPPSGHALLDITVVGELQYNGIF